jgi:hypothetical protein
LVGNGTAVPSDEPAGAAAARSGAVPVVVVAEAKASVSASPVLVGSLTESSLFSNGIPWSVGLVAGGLAGASGGLAPGAGRPPVVVRPSSALSMSADVGGSKVAGRELGSLETSDETSVATAVRPLPVDSRVGSAPGVRGRCATALGNVIGGGGTGSFGALNPPRLVRSMDVAPPAAKP